ncbi:hypothetical protein F4677DRAFT_360045 [Hypoxylon crocopeplum]|nr:hypothetical protein F4677DRAFT_360045 [Hypoxylon crocopeplum]
MELANHSYQEGLDGGESPADVIVSRQPRQSSLTNNFSYPRPEGRLSRHESNYSRSSLRSVDSIPGMTDSSDSETSFDEDSNYNTSASELWDSFWPDSAVAPGEQYPVLLRASQTPNYFTKTFSNRDYPEADETITISTLERDSAKTTDSSCGVPTPKPSPPRPATRAGTSSYSIYPKQEAVDLLRVPLPPRTSSLNAVPLSPPRRLKSSKSSVNLKSRKPYQNVQPLYPMPPVFKMPFPSNSAKSVPVSPAYPPPPPPTLRSATSAFNLRDRKSRLNQIQLNATTPLSPLVPTTTPPMPEPQPSPQPQLERYVSVFELDSDGESYLASSSFTKRIARGFHKKSASEKRGSSERRGSGDSESQDLDKGKESPSRKRGGSLGRILGLRSR